MAGGHFQRLEQSQRQILAPILQQNIQILLLNTVDLLQEINTKLDENPFLESEQDLTRNAELESFINHKVRKDSLSKIKEDDLDQYKKEIYENYSNYSYSRNYQEGAEDSKQKFLENTLTTRLSLYDYLKTQISVSNFLPHEKEIADVIISCIDDYGILNTSLEEIAQFTRVEMTQVESVLKKIQKLDPPGVGARNSREYLLLQLENIFGNQSQTYQVGKIYFDIFDFLETETQKETLKKKDLQNIEYDSRKIKRRAIKETALQTQIKEEEVEKILEKISSSTTPFPSMKEIDEDHASYIVPDIVVTVNPEDYSMDIKIFDDYLPQLKLNQDYRKYLRKDRGKEISEGLAALKQKYEEAKNFINLVRRRSSTLYNLTLHLVEIQKEFFLKGKEHIKPLTIKEMAENLEIHESTVSRIVNNKYIATPFGVFSLKYLFSHHFAGNAPHVSGKKVSAMIKKIIETEGGTKKLSDSKIEKILANMGIKISRRTVAKYRKKLDIGSSFER